MRTLRELHRFLLGLLYFTYVIDSSRQEKARQGKQCLKFLHQGINPCSHKPSTSRTPDRNVTALAVGPQPPKAFGAGVWGWGHTQLNPYLLSINSARERDCIPIGGEHGKMSCSSLNRHVVSRSVVVLKVRFCVRDLASDLLR